MYSIFIYCMLVSHTLYALYIFTMFRFEFNQIQARMLSDDLHRSKLNYNLSLLIPNVSDLLYKMDE